MSTIEELQKLREREDHVEFKKAEHNYPFAGGQKTDPKDRRHCVLGYVVAMANERGGRLVLGMADAYPHEVVGSDFAANETGNLEDEIYERLHIRVRTEELYADKQKRADANTIPLPQLLKDLLLIDDDGNLKYATLLLLGKSDAINNYLPQANVVIEYRTSQSQVRYSARQEYRLPLFVAIEKIWEYINQPACNPLLHINDLPRILDCPAFNKETIREALINAMIHRSLQMGSDIFIHLYPDMVEISNPGGFPYGVNIGNILTVNSSPRSRLMAEVIEKTGLIERSGQGVDIMFTNCIKEGKPLPDYSYSDDYQVDLRFYGEILDDAFYLFAQDICHTPEFENQMNTFDWLTLHYIRKGNVEALYKESCPKLLDMGLIAEDAYFGYVLSIRYLLYKPHVKSVAVQYDINPIQAVYHVIRRNGDASMSDFVAAFDGILTQKQVRNLIEGLCKTPLISSQGNARATRYHWV